jgi:Ser/Thr protein kinase RdoA (MazF antagonist)
MTAAPPADPGATLCPHCKRPIEEVARLAVSAEDDFICCAECAEALGLTARTLTRAEWDAADEVHLALAAFGVAQYTASKATPAPTLRPRATVWTITTGAKHLLLQRRDDAAAARFEGACRQRLADAQLPVAPLMLAASGDSVWDDERGACWTLTAAPRGVPFVNDSALWNMAGSIGVILAQVHRALQPLVVGDAPPARWACWTLEHVQARVAQWPPLSELTHELRDRAIERLETTRTLETLPKLPQTIVHGNFGRAALFWGALGPAGICAFDRAQPGAAVCDFALGMVNQHRPILRAAVVAYERERPLSEAERQALPEVLLLGTLLRVDRQLTVWQDKRRANEYARAITHLLDNAEGLRKLTTR